MFSLCSWTSVSVWASPLFGVTAQSASLPLPSVMTPLSISQSLPCSQGRVTRFSKCQIQGILLILTVDKQWRVFLVCACMCNTGTYLYHDVSIIYLTFKCKSRSYILSGNLSRCLFIFFLKIKVGSDSSTKGFVSMPLLFLKGHTQLFT